MLTIDENINILIVEDNPGDLLYIKTILSKTEIVCCIHSVENLADAIHYLEKDKSISLIFLDLFLPDSSGLETFNAINKVAEDLPIIVLTGYSDKRVAYKTIKNGAQDYLEKGEFDKKILYKTIQYSIERKRNLVKIKEMNERYTLATKATQDMVWDYDLEKKLFYRSEEGWKKLMGEDDILCSDNPFEWAESIHPEDIGKVYKNLLKVLNDGKKTEYAEEFRVKRGDGVYIHVQNKAYILRDKEGKALRLIGATRDITERKKSEKEKNLLIEELTQSNKDLQEFAYIISHNVRAPLSNILGFEELIALQQIPDPTLNMLFENVVHSSKQLNDTLQDLMNILLIRKKENVKVELLNFKLLFENVKLSLRNMIEEADMIFDENFNEVQWVYFNQSYLENIMYNLLSNSIKYKSTDRQLKVEVKTTKTDNHTILYYADNGSGIDLKRYKEKVFGLHQRFHKNSVGKGLGLYTVKSQVKALGGTVEIDSAIDMGTQYKILFKNLN
jgi:PAS domain S-box-containing protein